MRLGVLIDLISALVVLMALASAVAVVAAIRQWMVALAVLLDLLTAAGLLRLAADPSVSRVLSAATVLAIRHLVTWSLTNSRSAAIGKGAAVDSRAALARISKALAPLPLRMPPLDDSSGDRDDGSGHG
jgi:hypothetical protein